MPSSSWKPSQAYEPRAIQFKEVLEQAGWQIKLYVLLYGDQELIWKPIERGLSLALNALPQPARTQVRPGLGFLLAHQGRTNIYLVLCWWDQENELCTRVFVHPLQNEGDWRGAQENESFCVWDLEVMFFEREAYIAAILAKPDDPDIEGYLEHRYRS